MKPLFISALTVLILTFSSLLFSQQLHVALLNQNTVDYVEPLDLEVSPFDQVKFMATGGDFEITIHNANEIFNVDSDEIRIKLTEKHPDSQIFIVQDVEEEIKQEYEVYCNSTGGEPDAPPRIIIRIH